MADSISAKSKNQINLEELSVLELRSLIEQAEAKVREKQETARAALIAEMTEKAAALGLSLSALVTPPAGKVRKERKAPVGAIRYRGPNGEEWTGRGRVPQWMTELEKAGRMRAEFLV